MKENNVFTNSLLGAIIQDSGMRERSNASDKLFFWINNLLHGVQKQFIVATS